MHSPITTTKSKMVKIWQHKTIKSFANLRQNAVWSKAPHLELRRPTMIVYLL